MNDEPAGLPSGEVKCEPAKFDSTSGCGWVVVSNRSSETAMVRCVSSNPEEFRIGTIGALRTGGTVRFCKDFDWQLKPGERCYEPILFWPKTGEVKQATIQVTAESPGITANASIIVKGTSDYPPDLEAAEKVRERYSPELKKIPGVVGVKLSKSDVIKIDIEVDDEEQISAIRKEIPPKLGGYETEVTQDSGSGRGYAQ